jgi:hypothetical protein
MLPGAPSQLLPTVLLPTVLALARPGELLGAWLRGCRRPLRLRAPGRSLLAGANLGSLLCHCPRVAIRDGGGVQVLAAECLIAWRTLQIVTGAPYLPSLDQLQALYPGLKIRGTRIAVPLGLGTPEEALAACAAGRVPVAASWIDYRG